MNCLVGDIIFVSVTVVVIAVVMFFCFRHYINKVKKQRLETVYYVASLFRTPLTFIMSPLSSFANSDEYSMVQKDMFSFMQSNAERLLRLVNSVQLLLDGDDSRRLSAELTDLIFFVNQICNNFESCAKYSGFSFKYAFNIDSYKSYIDREKIDTAFYILLSNVFNLVSHGSSVDVGAKMLGRDVEFYIKVSDDGFPVGTYNEISAILDNSVKNTSLNPIASEFLIAKRLVELHNGAISSSFISGQGVVFTILLSPGTEFKSTSVTDFAHLRPAHLRSAKSVLSLPNGTDGSRNTILIVNNDKNILDYISTIFAPYFNIEMATNGQMGLDKAITTYPDIVVTDLPLPKMDGLELCRQLKSGVDTSHIPIVVLTALNNDRQRIDCVKAGVDCFLSVPFNPEYLFLMVQQILNQRNVLKHKYSGEVSLTNSNLDTISDYDLLKKVNDAIRKHISNAEFGVEKLSEEVGMSRGHFQRTFKAITGQNPNEFIKTTRLKMAAELLIEKNISVKEIADMTGFGSLSYFCTIFLKHFNMSPKQYRSQNRDSNNE